MAERKRTVGGVLGSVQFAVWVMVYLGVLCALGTSLPQGTDHDPKVVAWASAHPAFEALARATGFHHAFTSVLFLAGAALLSASTAVCAWRRTKAARSRARILGRARRGDVTALVARPDDAVPVAAGIRDEAALGAAREALSTLGIHAEETAGTLVSASHPWSVYGSPVFHWSLFALLCAMALGSLWRSEGLMGVPVGSESADTASSYGAIIAEGPLHRWAAAPRRIGVESFQLDYTSGGVNWGPTPTVYIRAANGAIVAKQRVYPNSPLKFGSITVHPSTYGLTPWFALVGTDGKELATWTQVVDFADNTRGGTAPVQSELSSPEGPANDLLITAAVPLDTRGGKYLNALPARPSVEVTVATKDGRVLATSRALQPGGALALPTGQKLRLTRVGYYARLGVVDDWTIPLVYTAIALATFGLCMAFMVRQRLVVVSLASGPDPRMMTVTARVWGGSGAMSREIRTAVRDAVSATDEESTQ